MSTSPNPNDWSQGPSEPTDQPYGSRIATFNDVFDNLNVASNLVFKPGIIVFYLAHMFIGGGIYVGMLVGLMASIGVMSELQDPGSAGPPPEFGPVFIVGMIVIMIFLFVLGALGAGPMASIRQAARGNMRAVEDIGTTFKTSLRAGMYAIPVMIMVNLIVTVGSVLLLLPGLAAAFFLSPAIYLVVTEQAGIFESLGMSFNWVKKHAGAVAALWVSLVGGYLVLFGVSLCLGFIPIVGSLIALPLQLAGYAFFFVIYVSAMLSIDAAENNWQLGQTQDGIEQVFE